MLAGMTGFRRGVPLINLDQGSSIPLGFVFELADKLAPSHIADRFCKAVVLDHVLDCQTLNADHLVFVNNAGRELVLVVTTTIIDAGMHTGDFETCFLSVLRSLLFLGMPTLGLCQPLRILCKEGGIANPLTGGEDDHRLESQIQTDYVGRWGQGLARLFNQDRDKIAVRTILGDRDRTRLDVLGKISMEVDMQRSIHLGKSELFGVGVPLECVCRVGGRLTLLLFLAGWVSGTALKEVLESSIQVPERLLNRDRGDFCQPGILLLEGRKHGSKIVVGELFSVFSIGDCESIQSPIVDEANTSKRLSQDDPLLISWIEPEFVCSLRLAHCLCALLVSLDVLLHCRQDLSTERAVMLFCNLFHLFQDLGRETECERFDLFSLLIHAIIIQSNGLHVKRLPGLKSPGFYGAVR
jgi:hypothetical protein